MADNKAFTITRESLNSPTNKTVVITGGSSGIGLNTAIILHELGNNIIIIDRQPPQRDASHSLTSSPRVLFQQADITSWTSQRAAFENGHKKFGSIDCVFVNAGIAEYKDQFFKDELDSSGMLAEPDRRVIDIDMQAADDTVRLAIHYMRKKGNGPDKGGSIVMTASLAGYLASAGAPLYSAAKHGIVGLMRALKHDTATLGIAVSVVAPGITLTPIVSSRKEGQSLEDWSDSFKKQGVPINDPRDVACTVVWLMGLGQQANGKGCLVQGSRVADLEEGMAKTRKLWMGQEMLDLFRGGRNAPLFPNKL